MKHLSLSVDGRQLTLVIPDQIPLRTAAKAIRGYHFEGRNDGHVVFSFPAAPDVASIVQQTFEPTISPSSKERINELILKHACIEAATAAKEFDKSLGFDAGLRTAPMAHQIAAMNFVAMRFGAGAKGAGLLMEQGTGKTLVAIGIANHLYKIGAIRWVLAIVPNSLRGTWGGEEGEILTHTTGQPPWILIPKGTRRERLAQAAEAVEQADGLIWVIMNYESFALNARLNLDHKELLEGWKKLAPGGLLIVDESTMVKNYRAIRTRAVIDLAQHFEHTMILTGTPVTSSPLDVYPQFEVAERGALGFQSPLAFDRHYAIRQTRRLRSGTQFQEVVGYRDLEDLEERVAKLSYRARAAECLDLPEIVTKRITVPMTPAQDGAMRSLRNEMMAELQGGRFIDGRNILTRYLRMSQILGGFVGVLDADGRPEEDVQAFKPNPKLDTLTEYLDLLFDDPEQKAVVFARFQAEIEAIRDMARERKWKPVTFYGPTPPDVREEGLKRFRKDPKTRLFIAQYQTGSKGLTLVEAANIIFYSLTFSLEDFQQARKRVHRIGQTKTVTEAYLLAAVEGRRGARQTLDHLILQALQRKQNFADIVTGDARAILEAL